MLLKAAIVVAGAAVAALALSGPGTRWQWWDFRVGLLLFAGSAVLGALALLLGGLSYRRQARGSARARVAITTMLAGLFALTPLVYGIVSARRHPPIHDVTTDLADPPQVRAALPERADGANPAPDTIDPAVVAQHRAAYADLQPLLLPVPPDQAFTKALAVAQSLHWTILAQDQSEGTIEATATTPWFGFRDDVVIRIRADHGGSRVDLRSVSRVGRSDAGANAQRIRHFRRLMLLR